MKANAPEKLYIDLFKGEFNVSYSPINNSVEYTRTDAFIERVEEWVKDNFVESDDQFCIKAYYDTVEEMIDDFKNFMKGEKL